MRVYANCREAFSEIRRDLFELGQNLTTMNYQNKNVDGNKDFDAKELTGYTFAILNTLDVDDIVKDTLEWNKAEFKERIDNIGNNPGEAYKLREDVWKPFLVRGKFHYTYSNRIKGQLQANINELARNPNTRQVIIQIHDRNRDQDLMGGKGRIPCSMYYQFLIRGNQLDIIYNMRSCDFFTHFRNDIWQAVALQNYIRNMVDLRMSQNKSIFTHLVSGKLVMQINSLHGFRKDFPKGVF